MPKVSIIVPVYNAEKYLEDTVNSIIKSTLKDIEIILVDDGSTDSSPQICENLRKSDNRIVVIHQENKGLSGARNTGIDKSTGDYIGFCDADDLVMEDMYQTLYDNAVREKADLSMVGIVVKSMNGKTTYIYNTKNKYSLETNSAMEFFLKYKVFGVSANTKLFKRDICESIKFENVKLCEDKLFLCDAIINSNKIYVDDVCKYIYLKREDSLTTSDFSSKKFEAIKVEEKIFERIQKQFKDNKEFIDMSKNRILISKLSVLRDCIGLNGYINYKSDCKKLINDIKIFKNVNKAMNIEKLKKLEIYIIKASFPLYYILVKTLYKLIKKY